MHLLPSLLLLATASLAHASSSLPCSGDALDRCIPWADNPGRTLAGDFTVNVTVTQHGVHGVHELTKVPVDTGSTGFLIAATKLGYTDAGQLAGCTSAAFSYLSSSQLYYAGCWLRSDVAFTSLAGGRVHANVSVFAVVETGTCHNHTAHACTDKTNVTPMPTHIQYMGVGFGRWGPEQPDATADRNPLLNIVGYGDADADADADDDLRGVRSGYILSDQGLVLGLRDADLADGWNLTRLARNDLAPASPRPEWTGTPMCVRVGDGPWTNGTALFDTGIVQAYLGVPPAAVAPRYRQGNHLADSAVVSLKAGVARDIGECAGGEDIGAYSFTVGDTATHPMLTPKYVQLVAEHDDGGFVNTGRHFFSGFALLFEEERGIVGLRRKTWNDGAVLEEDQAAVVYADEL